MLCATLAFCPGTGFKERGQGNVRRFIVIVSVCATARRAIPQYDPSPPHMGVGVAAIL
jgi:hypothetical protein